MQTVIQSSASRFGRFARNYRHHLLLALGCDYGQGFGYAPALSAQEAEVYLNESYVDGAAPVKARG